MNSIKPPNKVNKKEGETLIFLAGTIDMGKSEDWQSYIEKLYENDKNVKCLNPRRDDWDSSWAQTFDNANFSQQVNWELNALDKADIIIMYFSPDSQSPISLLELGLYANSDKIIVCCPEGFWRKGNVDIVCDRYNIPLFEDMGNMLEYLNIKINNKI